MAYLEDDDDDDANHLFPALLLANGALTMTDPDQPALGCLSEASVLLDGPCLDASDEDDDLAARAQEHYDRLSDGERDAIEVLAAHPQEHFDALTARESLVLHLLTMHPGSAIPELAECMGIKENYLYRLMSALYEKDWIVKEGPRWFAA